MVHGIALTAEVSLRNIDSLAESHHVVSVDLPGHGFTNPRAHATAGVAAKIRHLLGVADAFGFDRFAICVRTAPCSRRTPTAPTLVFWGRQDPGGTLAAAQAAVARMPAARLVDYDRCGHYPMIEHAQDWNREVLGFL